MVGSSLRTHAAAVGVLALGCHGLLPSGVSGQATPPQTMGIIRGIVVDETTEQGVESATIQLLGHDQEVRTGSDGTFAFDAIRHGLVSMRITASGHPAMVEVFELLEPEVSVEVRLPPISAVLSELLVFGDPPENETSGEPLTAADLVAIEVPAARARPGNVGQNDTGIYIRGIGSMTQSLEPFVYVDGVRIGMDNAMDILDRIPAEEVLDIRVLRGPAAAFLYPEAANGVILVETRGAGGGTDEPRQDR